VLVTIGLVMLSQVHGPYSYLAVWAFLGLAMRLTLYDAAFPALVQVTPSRGRRAISYLTLFGGLASTVFWPIGHALNSTYGWRTTFIAFAAINLLVCLPLHLLGLARRETEAQAAHAQAAVVRETQHTGRALEGATRTVAMVLFGAVAAASAVVLGAMAVHLVPLLEAAGLLAGTAVVMASFKGMAQVAGRIWDLTLARKWHPLDVGRVSIALLPLSFTVLMLGGANYWTALTFTLLFGVCNGLVTIVRGAVPLALFGAKGYGEILGILAAPYLVLAAVSPAAFALVVERWGYGAGEAILLGAGLASVLGMEVLTRWYRQQPEMT
jgi:predicted MFS family arabinose efflux permease